MKRLFSLLKWLYPGLPFFWLMLLMLFGVFLVLIGIALTTNIASFDYIQMLNNLIESLFQNTGLNINDAKVFVPVGIGLCFFGLFAMFAAMFEFNHSVLKFVAPDARKGLPDRIYQRRNLALGQRIVVIGGGTGLSTMLRGLKEYTSNITAIVTVTDNGGSSGRLVHQMGVLPPGDLRNCLVALADAEPTLAKLFQFRFDEDQEGLAGHSFGNLFIAAMTEIYKGNYEQAIAATSKVLAIRGKVYPSTTQNVCLLAEMEDASIIEGETQIAESPLPIKQMLLRPENAQPLPEALEEIRLADAIILGPGSVYTSIIPNLLVDGIADAIARSKAVKIYVCNVMTQPGETDGFTGADHVRVLAEHVRGKRLVNYVLVNTEEPDPRLLRRYKSSGQRFVVPDLDAIKAMGYQPVPGNLISQSDVVRHDPARLAVALFQIIERKRWI